MGQIIGSWHRRARTLKVPPPPVSFVGDDEPALAIGAWSCDLASEALRWSDGVFDIFGLDRGLSLDRRETLAFYDDDSREVLSHVRGAAIRERRPFSLETRIRRADGAARWMRITAVPKLVDGRVVSISGMKQDITEERAAWEELRALALRDPITGLANRAGFQREFLDLRPGCDAVREIGALVLFDMDRFKAINDRWGHLAGDACLTIFGRRLTDAFPEARMISRIGGDEFALLLPSGVDRMVLERRLRQAMPLLVAPFPWRGGLLPMGVSAGLALGSQFAGVDPCELFATADAELYRCKAARAHGGTSHANP